MPRKKKEEVTEQLVACTCAFPCGGTTDGCPSAPATGPGDTDGQTEAAHILDKLSKQVDIPDDKPVGISLRDRAVLHLLAGADLHRIAPDAVTHRIKRCIDIANQVVELLGEDNAEV